MWITFVRPLFLPLAAMGPILTNTDRSCIQMKMRTSLKKFLKLPRNFSTEILNQVVPIDFLEWMEIEKRNNTLKWVCRKQRRMVPKEELGSFSITFIRYLPIEFATLLKCFTAWCRECQKPFYPKHLEEHGIERIDLKDLFEDLKKIEDSVVGEGNNRQMGKRRVVIEAFGTFLKSVLVNVNKVLKDYANEF